MKCKLHDSWRNSMLLGQMQSRSPNATLTIWNEQFFFSFSIRFFTRDCCVFHSHRNFIIHTSRTTEPDHAAHVTSNHSSMIFTFCIHKMFLFIWKYTLPGIRNNTDWYALGVWQVQCVETFIEPNRNDSNVVLIRFQWGSYSSALFGRDLCNA